MIKQKNPQTFVRDGGRVLPSRDSFVFRRVTFWRHRKLVSFPDFSGLTLGRREFIDRIGGSVQENRRGVVTGILKSHAV